MDDDTPPKMILPTPDQHRLAGLSTFEHLEVPRGLSSSNSITYETLGPFEVHEIIGRGGMGVVLSGMHIEQRVPVAIKLVTGSGPIDARLRRRLRHEVQAVAALNHPGIVTVFDYGELQGRHDDLCADDCAAGTPYFVMELTQRSTLRDVAGRVAWSQARAILLTVLDALAHAHACGVVHRDIKPDNILLARRGGRLIPKLADFGISFAVEGGSATAHCVGTPRYMAPEQINKPWRTHGPWTDLYSLGCVAYQLLSGKEVFEGTDVVDIYQQHFRARHPPIDPVVEVPAGFERWLDMMLSRSPSGRFQTAADAARALDALEAGGSAGEKPHRPVRHDFIELTSVLDPLLSHDSSHLDDDAPASRTSPGALELVDDQWPPSTIEPTSMRMIGAGRGLYGMRSIPLVGREAELDKMWSILQAARRSATHQILVVRGAQGTGKSRLVEWFNQRLDELGAAHILRATHSAEGGPADGLSAMLARHFRTFGATDAQAEKIIQTAMNRAAAGSSYEWKMMTRIVRPTLDESTASAAVQIASPAQRYAVVGRYLGHLADTKPVVVWCDDVQWGNDVIDFARFLRRAHLDDAGPILVVLSVRDDSLAERPVERQAIDDLADEGGVDQLRLQPLDSVDHQRLVRELLLLGGDLAREVARRTAGNPLFAVELIGDWVERGVLEVGPDGFVLGDGVEPSMPDHLHDMWVRRIEALLGDYGEDARRGLELAAALGQDVSLTEWREVCQRAGVGFDESLSAELVERRFARRTEHGWAFAHPIVRESLERLARDGGRWRVHRRACAETIQTLYDLSKPTIAERYGRYAMSAHQYLQALEPLMRAARGRRGLGEYHDAQQLLSSYIECLERGGVAERDRRWGDAWVMRSRTYLNSAQAGEARRWARRALQGAGEYDWAAIGPQAMGWLALAKQWMGDKDAARELRRAFELLDGASADHHMRGVYGSVAHGLSRLGDFSDARRLLRRDLDSARRHDDQWAIANNSYLHCRLAAFNGDWDTALERGQTAQDLFESIGHLPGIGLCMELTAEIQRLSGHLERAEDTYRDCIELQETIGYPPAVAQMNLACILLKRRRPHEAERRFLTALNTFESSGRHIFRAVATAGLFAVASTQGYLESAGDRLESLQAFLSDTDAAERDLAVLVERGGDDLCEGGQFRDAVAAYTLAVQQWQRLGDAARVQAVMEKLGRWS